MVTVFQFSNKVLPTMIQYKEAVEQGRLPGSRFTNIKTLGAYSQNSNVSHHLSAKLTVSPSEHLILDSQQNLRQTLTLVT